MNPLFILVASLAHPLAMAAPAPELDTILTKSLGAMGGEAALRGLNNVRISATWTENGMQFTGDYRATREGRMRIDVFIDRTRVYSEGLDDEGAWEQAGTEKVAAVGVDARNALAHGIAYRFEGIWLTRESGHQVQYDGIERVGGVDYLTVKLAFRDGFETFFLVNPQTWLPERQRDVRAYHPANDPKKIVIEVLQGNFKKHCGVAMPHVSRDINLSTSEVLTERKVTELVCNVPVESLDIERPR